MKRILILLTLYSIAMALLEAAVVVYMRRLYYPANPMELFPLEFLRQYDPLLELSREIATVIMILTVALLAERRSLTRSFAAFVFVFGTWDLFYYGWLKVLMGWPRTWLEWDVLFLIPMVWLGPWICPALIAVLFIVWGSWALTTKEEVTFTWASLSVFVCGAAAGLLAFMQPAFSVQGLAINEMDELAKYMPNKFWWWLFGASYLLMATSLCATRKAESSTMKEADRE